MHVILATAENEAALKPINNLPKYIQRHYMTSINPEQIYSITRPDAKLLKLYIIRSILSLVAFPVVFLVSYFKYHTMRYRFDDEGIAMSWGLLWRREINLTYARIQDIHVSRGLIERWLGLATVQIQTASGSGSAEMSIVGILEFESLRDFLYTKMRGARFGEPDLTTSDNAETKSQQENDVAMILLTEIRDELVLLRQRQSTSGGGGEQ